MTTNAPLGMIYLPSNPGTPVGRFDFIVDPKSGTQVEIGTPVAADTTEGVVVGAVVDMRTVGHSKDPVSADLGNRYDSNFIASISEVVVATVQVFHSTTMRSVRAGIVRSATPEEMLKSTGFYDMDWPVPAGVVPLADGALAKVCFDGHALMGPESAHLMVGGLSGQAAKTSYMGMLLKSAVDSGGKHGESTAALIFNVKGEDLIYLDEPPAAGYELQESDLAIYEALGVSPDPFKDVTVYAPSMPGGRGTRSPRADAVPIRWDLTTVWPYLRYFFPGMDWYGDDKLQAFLNEFYELKMNSGDPRTRIETFAALESWMQQMIDEAMEPGEDGKPSSMAWRSHHIATFRRIKRMLTSLPYKGGGIITKETSRPEDDVPVTGWEHGHIVVVDLAGLTTDVQGVIIARTLERLMRSAEAGELGVSHAAIVVDEANTWAPQVGNEMNQVKKAIAKVAKEGRYAGLSLFGAGQALSKVDDMVVSNAASRALGRTADIELASGAYGRLSPGITERIATLPKGAMVLWHYSFRAPLMIRFPRPAWKTGKPKAGSTSRPKVTGTLGMREKSVERLVEGVRPDQVERILAGADDPAKARAELERVRVPDMKKQVLHEPTDFDPEDPFSLG